MTAAASESAWDYPRPPRLERCSKRVRVLLGGAVIADTTQAYRVLETSHPPVYYVPAEDVAPGSLEPSTARGSLCEWKGMASYLDAIGGDGQRVERAGWTYLETSPEFEAIRDAVAFYAGLMDECTVDGERAVPQEGDFYGGWITSQVAGPFKGAPGTLNGYNCDRSSETRRCGFGWISPEPAWRARPPARPRCR